MSELMNHDKTGYDIATTYFGDTWVSENTLRLTENGDYEIYHKHYDWKTDEKPSSCDSKTIDTAEAFDFLKGWRDEYDNRRGPEIHNEELALQVEQGYVMDLGIRIFDCCKDMDWTDYVPNIGQAHSTSEKEAFIICNIIDDIYHGNVEPYIKSLGDMLEEDLGDTSVAEGLVLEIAEYKEYAEPRIEKEKEIAEVAKKLEESNKSMKDRLFALRDKMDAKQSSTVSVDKSIAD